jgi:hypothetical protein
MELFGHFEIIMIPGWKDIINRLVNKKQNLKSTQIVDIQDIQATE